MSYTSSALRDMVRRRANNRCEYCLIHEQFSYQPHEVDHIIAEKHGGETIASNLCLSCYFCNRHKGSDLTSIDPETDEIERLFRPRTDIWSEHFKLDGAKIIPLTSIGRVTVRLLKFNETERTIERAILITLRQYPEFE